jgi:hypothetical protein
MLSVARSTLRYRSRMAKRDAAAATRMRELAAQYPKRPGGRRFTSPQRPVGSLLDYFNKARVFATVLGSRPPFHGSLLDYFRFDVFSFERYPFTTGRPPS